MSEALKKLRYKTATDIILELEQRIAELEAALRAVVDSTTKTYDMIPAPVDDAIDAAERLLEASDE